MPQIVVSHIVGTGRIVQYPHKPLPQACAFNPVSRAAVGFPARPAATLAAGLLHAKSSNSSQGDRGPGDLQSWGTQS